MASRWGRGGWLFATGVVSAFAVYISLVPFDFVSPPHGSAIGELIWTSLRFELRSLSNLAANGIMFLPIGFCGAAILVNATSGWRRWLLAAVMVSMAAGTLSVTVEALQIFVRNRTPSLTDVAAHLTGTVLGLGAWALVTRRAGKITLPDGAHLVGPIALGCYALLFSGMLLLQPQVGGQGADRVTARIGDFILAAPMGALLVLAWSPPARATRGVRALVTASVFFLAVELLQLMVRPGQASAFDVVWNVVAASAGIGWVLVGRDRKRSDVSRQPRAVLAVAGLVLCAAAYASYNLVPFDFDLSRDLAASRWRRLVDIPFIGYYQNQEFKALRDVFVKIGLALPIGWLFQHVSRTEADQRGRLVTGAWVMAAAGFFFAVELGQVFLPTRYPDNTDVILASVAVWLGVRLARQFRSVQS